MDEADQIDWWLLELMPEDRYWRPDPFPGSDTAASQGCTCPPAQPWPGALKIGARCPLHELERATN